MGLSSGQKYQVEHLGSKQDVAGTAITLTKVLPPEVATDYQKLVATYDDGINRYDNEKQDLKKKVEETALAKLHYLWSATSADCFSPSLPGGNFTKATSS